MSTLSQSDIAHLAKLARLEVGTEDAERYAGQLTTVVAYVEQLQQVPTEGISDGRGVTGLQNVLAADVPREKTDLANLDVERALASAPRRDGQFIEVRAVLGGESGEA